MGIPKDFNEPEKLKEHFENLNYKVREIMIIKNYTSTLNYYKDMNEI